jgi:hypothetical protein
MEAYLYIITLLVRREYRGVDQGRLGRPFCFFTQLFQAYETYLALNHGMVRGEKRLYIKKMPPV